MVVRSFRRRDILKMAGAMLPLALPAPLLAAVNDRNLVVYKTPWCGCCGQWVKIIEKAGFTAQINDLEDLTDVRRQMGVPDEVQACHTATLAGYAVEGHVPAKALEKLVAQRPAIRGIAVPGMPAGSPGMGYDPSAKFDVITFGQNTVEGSVIFMKIGA